MILKNIKLENIRSYKNLDLNFPEGSLLLSGDIGCGKTTVLLAIEFALFGLQPGQKGSALLREGEKEGLVKLEMEIDGKTIFLERSLKRSSKTIGQENTSIIIDNEKKELAITELKNQILSLLNYPGEFAKKTNTLYKFTVYTPQEEMKQIILEDAESRLNTLRYVFGIDKYKTIQENNALLTAKLREEIRKKEGIILNLGDKKIQLDKEKLQLSQVKGKIIETESSFLIASAAKKKIQQEILEIQAKIEEKRTFEKEVDKSLALMAGKRENIISLNKEKQNIQTQIESLSKLSISPNEIEEITEKINKLKMDEENSRRIFTDLSGKIASLESRRDEAKIVKDRVSGLAMCPTCLQSVNQEYKQHVLENLNLEISRSDKSIIELSDTRNQTQNQILTIKSDTDSLNKKKTEMEIIKVKLEQIKDKESRIKELEKNISLLEADNELLNKHAFSLKQSISELSKYDNIFKAKSQELEQSAKQEKNVEILLAEQKKEIEFIQNDIKNLEIEIVDKELVREQLKQIQNLESWLSSEFSALISFTEKNVLTKLREQFSKIFNDWFSILVSDSLSVRLNEDFSPIISQQDFELDYSYLSGGERTAVALAYRLALNQVINSLLSKIKTRDIVILDEPTDGFSEAQLDKMRDVLQQLKVKQLILVSHEQKIEGFVDKVIRFKKEAGESRIEKDL
jgi:exonuclease SbcC